MRSLNALLWRNLTAHPLRSILTVLAITLGVAMVLAATIVGQAAGQSAAELSAEGPQVDLEVFSRDGAPCDAAVLDTLRASPDVEVASPSLRVEVELVLSKAEGGVDPEIAGAGLPTVPPLTLLGVDPEIYADLHQLELANGAFLDRPDTIVLPMKVAIDHGLNVGDEVTLAAEGRKVTLTVAGRLKLEQDITALADANIAYVPLAVAQALNGTSGQIGQVEVVLHPGANLDQAKDDLAAQLSDELIVAQAAGIGNNTFAAIVVQIGLAMVGIIMLFAAAFVIMNAFAMSVTARTREIGSLRALGMTRRQVMYAVLAEAGLLGLAGAALGLLVGVGLAWGVMRVRGTLDDVAFAVPWWGIAVSTTMGLTVTLIGALQPARRASRVSPLTALRTASAKAASNWYERHGGRVGGMLLLILLPGLMAAAFILQPDFFEAFAFLGIGMVGVLTGTVLLMPALVHPMARLVGPALARWMGTAGRLAADNLTRNKLRTVLTAGALTIGLTSIIATSALLTVSFKGGLNAFFGLFHEDGMVLPDIPALLTSGEMSIENSFEVVNAELDPAVVEAVTELDVGTMVYYGFAPVPTELSTYLGAPGVFVDPEVFLPLGNFDFFEGDADSALEMMQRGRALLLMPITAERLEVGVGDTVMVQTVRGGEIEFTVAGIGGNTTNFTVFSYADGETYFDLSGPSWLGVVVPGGQDVDAMLTLARETIEPFDDVVVFDMRDSGVGGLFKIVDQLQMLLNALLLLAVVVASLGVVNTMVINVAERQHEIALLRAVGATQRQVRQSVVTEAATLGLMAALVATALGLIMLMLFAVILLPNSATSVGLRINWETAAATLPPALRDLSIAAALSLIFGPLVAALAAYYPARQAAALDVIEATRSERVTLKPAGTRRPERRRRRRRMARSLAWAMAWRSLAQHRLRTILSALAVALGAAMVVAASVTSSGVSNALESGENIFADYFTDTAGIVLTSVGFVILVAAGFLIFNAFAMAVTQRRRQIGALRSLGMTRRQVMQQLLVEALITGGLGTLLGLVAGPLFGHGMLAAVRQFDVEIGRGTVSVSSLVLAVVMGLGITLLSVMIPARRATRISPLVALRQTTTSANIQSTSTQSLLVGLLLIVALTVYLIIAPPGKWTGNNPPWEWIMTLLLSLPWLVALLLILPALIGGVGWAARGALTRLLGATGRLMTDNLGRDRRRVTLTVLTFAVGLTVIAALNGMLAFMNDVLLIEAAQGSLQQVSWFIYPFDRRSGLAQIQGFNSDVMGISPEVQEDVHQLATGRAQVSEGYMATIPEIGSPMPGFPSPIYDLDSLTRPGLYTFVEGDWETARPIMESSCGLLLPPAVAARNGVGIGDALTVTGKDGPVDCTVAGIGHGGTAPMSIVSAAAKDAFVDGPPASLTVWPLEGTDVVAFEAELRALADRHGDDAWVSTPEDEVQAVVETSDQLESMAYSLLVLAVVAAALGMVNTTVMSVAERRHELGLLRAVGATRRQTMYVVAGEAALMGLVGGVVGLIAGAGLTVIYCLSYGGIPFGLVDLDLWNGAWQAVQPALLNGLIGIVIAPIVSAGAAWLPTRSILRGTAIETIQPERLQVRRTAQVRRTSLTWTMAWRNLAQHRLRTALSALAVALGAAMTVAADITSGAIMNALSESESAQTFLTGLLDQLDSMLTLVGVGITFAAGFLVFNALAMSVTQRRRQIGALRSLGMVRRQVMRLVLVEALITGGAGTLVGLIAGPLLGRGTIALMKAWSEGIFVFAETRASLSSLLLATVLGIGVTLLSALVPAWRATRISPLAALRQETGFFGKSTVSSRTWFLGLLVILALIVYLVVALPGEWVTSPWDAILTGSFVLLWLGSLALILPAFIGGVGRWVRAPLMRLWGATGRLIADNLGRGRGRVVLTILTLAVALTMIVSMTGFIRFMFFELMLPKIESAAQLGAWMLAPFDYMAGMSAYVDLETLELPPDALAEVCQVVEGRGRVMPVHFVIVPELSFLGSSYFSFVADPYEWRQGGDTLFTFTEGDWETALPLMESGCGVLVAPLVASRNSVSVGDTFEVTGADGPVECTVAGIGAPFVSASIIGTAVGESFGITEPLVAVVWPLPGVDRNALETDITAALDRYPGVELGALEDQVELQTQMMDILPNMLNALLLLAIVSAALGVVNTTMMSIAERQRELGLLRAVGATRRQVIAVMTGEAALMGLIGGGLGLVAGAGVVVILAVTYGGNAWGVLNLDLWGAAWRSLQPALFNGLVGLLAAPLICAGAAWLPVRSLLCGSAIETMEPAR